MLITLRALNVKLAMVIKYAKLFHILSVLQYSTYISAQGNSETRIVRG